MKNTGFLLLILLFLSGCRYKDKVNKNIIFENYHPPSSEYREKLLKHVKSHQPDDFTYVFNRYLVVDGQEYIGVRFMKKDFVAEGLILVKDWSKLTQLRKVKGISYLNAEIKGLTVEHLSNNPNSDFLYKGHERIVD